MKKIKLRHIYFTDDAVKEIDELEKELVRKASAPKPDPDSEVVIKK